MDMAFFQSLAIVEGCVGQQTNHLSNRAVDNGTDVCIGYGENPLDCLPYHKHAKN